MKLNGGPMGGQEYDANSRAKPDVCGDIRDHDIINRPHRVYIGLICVWDGYAQYEARTELYFKGLVENPGPEALEAATWERFQQELILIRKAQESHDYEAAATFTHRLNRAMIDFQNQKSREHRSANAGTVARA